LYGVLVAAISPHRELSESYRTFFELAAAQVVTAIRNARSHQDALLRAERLAEIDRAKTAFFSNVSHEFRTPLTLMLGPLEDGIGSSTRSLAGEALETTYRNALRLLKLVNALLDFSRIEAGRTQASFRPADLAEITRELASAFRSAIERAGLAYEVDCETLREPIWIDRDMWEKVVLNLLSNALKFTFEGKIELRLRGEGERAVLTVRDTGIGVADHDLPKLFDRFHRIEGVRARTHEGSGIGLALVQELVKLHGGEIVAESAPDRGTTFSVALRFGTAHLPSERIGAEQTVASASTAAAAFVQEALRWVPENDAVVAPSVADGSARILVVDDNADMREYLARLLRARWKVDTISDGQAALEAIERDRPTLVITDVMMPRLDGFGLLRRLRSDPRTRSLPVIMLSARAGEESLIEGLEAGADDYLVKPFSARELVARVATQLEIHRLGERLEVSAREASAANRAKDEFLAMLGHELRNPLAPMLTALQVMRLKGAQSRELEILERQVGHLTRLVDDLLDVSRITRGTIELRKQDVELADIVVRAIEIASPLVEQRRQHLEVRMSRHGLAVNADSDRMAQVISNLLTNASKYSDAGSTIVVEASARGRAVRVSVRDEGVGIAPDMVDRVFDVFFQQPQTLDRAKGGLGLGLAIVKSLVDLHGGTMRAHSDGIGKGSEFVIELPRVSMPLHAPNLPPLPFATRSGSAGGTRILIVDDNEDAVDALKYALEEVGYVVEVAYDGPSAIERAEAFRPEVALVDIGLPVMDGYELAQHLRQSRSDGDGVRLLVAVTGYGQEADKRRAQAAGFDRHLVKPVDLANLVQVVKELPSS
jgi:signal transduction histidine kinase